MAALLAALAVSGHGQPTPAPSVESVVPATVDEVVSGGYWQADGRAGHYRVVVMTAGFEALSSRVFVEWVIEPSLPEEAPKVVAAIEPDASSVQPLTWKPSLQAMAPGCLRVVLRGTHSMQPGQHPVRAYWALRPGELVAATASNRPAACRRKAPAARKSG